MTGTIKTMRQQLTEFLINLSEIYPIDKTRKAETVITEYVDYLLQIAWNKKIDFSKVKNAIFDEYKYKSFPEPSFIRDILPRGFVSGLYSNPDTLGRKKVLRLPNNNGVYLFEVVNFGRDWNEIIKREEEKYKDNEEERVIVEDYPKEALLIGKEIKIWG